MTAGCESIRQPELAIGRVQLPRLAMGRGRLIVFCLLGIAVNALVFGPALQLTANGVNDFMSIYSGTRLAFTGGMYDLTANLQVQRETAGWENVNRLFLRPPFDALLMWPLGKLPYLMASHLWEFLIVATVSLFCFLWPGDRKVAALACCWSLPVFYVFANGQDIGILLVLIALTMREMKRGRETRAGLIFSLCSIKFHLLLLLPLLIVRLKLWRFLAGLALGGAVLFVVSMAPGGVNWPVRYLKLLANPIGNPWPEMMPTVHGLTYGLPHPGLWQITGTLAVALVAWLAMRRGGFEYGLAAVLVGGILVAPHAYLSDCAMAVPALLITFPLITAAWQRNLHFWLFSPAGFIWAMVQPTWITTLGLVAFLALMAFGLAGFARQPEKTVYQS